MSVDPIALKLSNYKTIGSWFLEFTGSATHFFTLKPWLPGLRVSPAAEYDAGAPHRTSLIHLPIPNHRRLLASEPHFGNDRRN